MCIGTFSNVLSLPPLLFRSLVMFLSLSLSFSSLCLTAPGTQKGPFPVENSNNIMRTWRFFACNVVGLSHCAERAWWTAKSTRHKKRLRIRDIAVWVQFDLCLKYINLRSLLHILLYIFSPTGYPTAPQTSQRFYYFWCACVFFSL